VVATAGTTLDNTDFFALPQALAPRFQPNASWLMHMASLNRARSIVAGTGLATPMLDDGAHPPRLLGKPAYEASTMDDTVTGGAVADYLAVYGDVHQAYAIADRVGTTIELVPHLVGANRRATGQRDGSCAAGLAGTSSTPLRLDCSTRAPRSWTGRQRASIALQPQGAHYGVSVRSAGHLRPVQG
jgi:hypothetical protein